MHFFFFGKVMFWNKITCSTAGIASSELFLLNKWIQRLCDWENFSPGCSRSGKCRQARVALHPSLQWFYSWGSCPLCHSDPLFLTVVLASLYHWLADSFLGLCSSVLTLRGPQDSVLATRATFSLLPEEKQVLISDEDGPMEGRPWHRSSPSCRKASLASSKCTPHLKSFPSSCSRGDCSSLAVLFTISCWYWKIHGMLPRIQQQVDLVWPICHLIFINSQ